MDTLETRVALLELIARNTEAALKELRQDLRTDYRWLMGIMLAGFTGIFGLMAHGFKWF